MIYNEKKPAMEVAGLDVGGDGGSRTPVRKHSAVGTTCLVSSLALTVPLRTNTRWNREPIIDLAIQCKGDPSRDPASIAPARTHRQIRNGAGQHN